METKIQIIEENNSKYVIFESDNFKMQNNIAINMGRKNNNPHLVEAHYEVEDIIKGEFDITEYVPLMSTLPNFPGRDDVFPVIRKIAFVLNELRNSFICEPDVVLKKEYIFVDKETSVIKFIASPEILTENNSFGDLIDDICSEVNWKKNENKSFLNKFFKAIDGKATNYEFVIDVINEILSEPVQYLANIPATVQNAGASQQNMQSQPVPPVGQPMPPFGQQVQPMGQPVPPFGQQVQPMGQPVPPFGQEPHEEAAGYDTMPASSTEVNMMMGMNNADNGMMNPEPVMGQPMSPIDQPIQNDFEEDDDYAATTLLGVSAQLNIMPSLIRAKNGEKVVISKPVFVIGKDPSKVDYCIFDNTAISRVHARIISKNGTYFIVDNKSTNHIYVNGALINPYDEVQLMHNSRIRLADEDFEFMLK